MSIFIPYVSGASVVQSPKEKTREAGVQDKRASYHPTSCTWERQSGLRIPGRQLSQLQSHICSKERGPKGRSKNAEGGTGAEQEAPMGTSRCRDLTPGYLCKGSHLDGSLGTTLEASGKCTRHAQPGAHKCRDSRGVWGLCSASFPGKLLPHNPGHVSFSTHQSVQPCKAVAPPCFPHGSACARMHMREHILGMVTPHWYIHCHMCAACGHRTGPAWVGRCSKRLTNYRPHAKLGCHQSSSEVEVSQGMGPSDHLHFCVFNTIRFVRLKIPTTCPSGETRGEPSWARAPASSTAAG